MTKAIAATNGLFAAATRTFTTWGQRVRTRRDLANLDPHQLRDIGVSAHEARREARKPFFF